MATNVQTYTTPPEALFQLLAARLPTSLPLLRRLQFTKFPVPSSTSSDARTVLVSDGALEDASHPPTVFTAAYFDFARGPDTQMWLYSTLEDPRVEGVEPRTHERQLSALVREIIRLRKLYGGEMSYPGCLLLGSLDSRVRGLLEAGGWVKPRRTGEYDKWLFRLEDLPDAKAVLPEGMRWEAATLDDCQLVVSRTDIPRRAELLVQWPNLTIKLADNTPIAWAFLAPDGSLASLTCEPPYRRRGLAKALVAKLFRQGTPQYGSDGWCSSDVSADNEGSRAMCRSLNGTQHWIVSWVLLDLDESIAS